MEQKLATDERLEDWCEPIVEQLRLRVVGPDGLADVERDCRRSGLRATAEPADDRLPASTKPCTIQVIHVLYRTGKAEN